MDKGATRGPIDVLNPSTNQTILQLFPDSDEQVDAAVASSWRAFRDDSWKKLPALDRGKLINKLASVMRENSETLARLEAINTGIPIRQSRLESASSAHHFEYFPGWAGKITGSAQPLMNNWFTVINTYRYGSEIPFGGIKKSGIGREHGQEALREYTSVKSVCLGLSRWYSWHRD